MIENGVQVQKENEKFTAVCSRSQLNIELGHFTSVFCRGREKNTKRFDTPGEQLLMIIAPKIVFIST